MQLKSLNRWKAAAIHLGVSAVIAATVVTIMLLVWYPPPYFDAMGGQGLLKILVGVDVTLGPLLTLIIFDAKKKSLKFDLSVIAALQIAALAYGVWVMFEARPVYTAFAHGSIRHRFRQQIWTQVDLDAGAPEYRELSLDRDRASSASAIRTRTRTSRNGTSSCSSQRRGKDAPQFPKYYVPYADIAADVLKKAKPLSTLVKAQSRRTRRCRRVRGRDWTRAERLRLRAARRVGTPP